jgi:hypothetical protein
MEIDRKTTFRDAINTDSDHRRDDLDGWMRGIRMGISVYDMYDNLIHDRAPLYCHTISYDVWNRWRLLSRTSDSH